MKHGIGVRYSEQGVRLLKLVQGDKGLKIIGVAAGPLDETIASFFEQEDPSDATTMAVGLGPGDFLSSYMIREDGMEDSDIETHLRWEIEHKIISEPENYTFDFFITDSIGCVFAGRNELIEKEKKAIGGFGPDGKIILTDVESVALYNGCDGAGEIGSKTVLIVSLEAEGLSSLVLDNGSLRAIETFPITEKSLLTLLPGLDRKKMNDIDDETVERMAGYVIDTLARLTSFGEHKDKPTVEQIVLSGGGVNIGIGNLPDIVNEKTGIQTDISNPLKPLLTEVPENQTKLTDFNAAFTSCFGLALRALED